MARAVAASSAVPLLFNPVVIGDYHDCKIAGKPDWMEHSAELTANNPALDEIIRGLETYSDKEKRKYVHLVDGGITDNPGLRAIYEVMALAGGRRGFTRKPAASPRATQQLSPSMRLRIRNRGWT